jgi:hypothetical protein
VCLTGRNHPFRSASFPRDKGWNGTAVSQSAPRPYLGGWLCSSTRKFGGTFQGMATTLSRASVRKLSPRRSEARSAVMRSASTGRGESMLHLMPWSEA